MKLLYSRKRSGFSRNGTLGEIDTKGRVVKLFGSVCLGLNSFSVSENGALLPIFLAV